MKTQNWISQLTTGFRNQLQSRQHQSKRRTVQVAQPAEAEVLETRALLTASFTGDVDGVTLEGDESKDNSTKNGEGRIGGKIAAGQSAETSTSPRQAEEPTTGLIGLLLPAGSRTTEPNSPGGEPVADEVYYRHLPLYRRAGTRIVLIGMDDVPSSSKNDGTPGVSKKAGEDKPAAIIGMLESAKDRTGANDGGGTIREIDEVFSATARSQRA